MLFATRVAQDMYSATTTDTHYVDSPWYSGIKPDYFSKDENIMSETNISHEKSHAFSKELSKYLEDKGDFFKCTEAPYDRNTRAPTMSIIEARQICDDYILLLWKAIRKRVAETDFSVSPCSFSEAPAESIFSTYGRVTKGRESMTITNAVGLTRIACHGPPIPMATPDAKAFCEQALEDFPSSLGLRFCTHMWHKEATSKVMKRVQSQKWDW